MGLGPKRAHSINKQGTPLFEIAMFYNNVPDYQLQKSFSIQKKLKGAWYCQASWENRIGSQ